MSKNSTFVVAVKQILNKRAIEASDKERPIPDLRTGDIVEIKLVIPFSCVLDLVPVQLPNDTFYLNLCNI